MRRSLLHRGTNPSHYATKTLVNVRNAFWTKNLYATSCASEISPPTKKRKRIWQTLISKTTHSSAWAGKSSAGTHLEQKLAVSQRGEDFVGTGINDENISRLWRKCAGAMVPAFCFFGGGDFVGTGNNETGEYGCHGACVLYVCGDVGVDIPWARETMKSICYKYVGKCWCRVPAFWMWGERSRGYGAQ